MRKRWRFLAPEEKVGRVLIAIFALSMCALAVVGMAAVHVFALDVFSVKPSKSVHVREDSFASRWTPVLSMPPALLLPGAMPSRSKGIMQRVARL